MNLNSMKSELENKQSEKIGTRELELETLKKAKELEIEKNQTINTRS